jgi:hypothetical protein
MKVEVRTREYEISHGKMPKGHGNWAFYMGRESDDLSKVHWFTGNYGDVKKQACAKARELGIELITVGS